VSRVGGIILTVSVASADRRAILVDIGGVLCSDDLPTVTALWSARLRVSDRSLLAAIFGGSDETVLVGLVSEPAWWRVVAARLDIGPETTARLRADIVAAGTWDEQLLDALRRLRVDARTAIVSNAWPHVRARLAEARLEDVTEEVILSCEVGYAKPSPEIYRLALDRLEVTPEHALMIDDTAGHVLAAESAGLRGHRHEHAAGTIAAIEDFLGGGQRRCVPRG
jgi:putative hydrolase of the HAD superfamily